jgi:hypothetical protein
MRCRTCPDLSSGRVKIFEMGASVSASVGRVLVNRHEVHSSSSLGLPSLLTNQLYLAA